MDAAIGAAGAEGVPAGLVVFAAPVLGALAFFVAMVWSFSKAGWR
jgi:hypothetical protein